MKRKFVQIIIHAAAWACFLMLPLVFFPQPKDASLIPEQAFTLFFLLSNFFYISFYYFNANFLIPRFLEQKNLAVYWTIIMLLLIFFGIFPRLYQGIFGEIQRFPSMGRLSRNEHLRHSLLSPGSIAIFLLVFIFSTGNKVIVQWLKSEQKSKQVENEKLNAELSLLKAQINPHFLFNTLNNIYALAAANSELTAPAVMKLSSIMRYVLTEARNDLVPLDKEVSFMRHYIELQKMRITEKTCIQLDIKGDPAEKRIAPLLFLPFVENAFKYGISTRDKSPIHIELDIRQNQVLFSVTNNKYNQSLLHGQDKTGIGINNTRRRLDLLYPGKHQLELIDGDKQFSIKLLIEQS